MEKDWNPDAYLKFNRERLLPSVDLVSKIDQEHAKSIIDIGCGPGNSTQVLNSRWPKAKITGIDNSPAMIKKAKNDYPDQNWLVLDAHLDNIPGKFDIVFSNATIQWIPDHYNLFKKFKNLLSENGTLAIQLPLFFKMTLGQSILNLADNKPWSVNLGGVNDLFTIHNSSTYYDYLAEFFQKVEIWETSYMHIFNSHQSVFDMIYSTGLRPYLHALTDNDERALFEKLVLDDIKTGYPAQSNGNVIFPFMRLFLMAKN